jgi:hypothetical protein
MAPAAKFHASISSITVLAMFWLIDLLKPVLEAHKPLAAVGGLLGTVGTYKSLAFALGWVLLRWRWAKRKFFGPYYMEGTWIGWFKGHAGDKRVQVEYYTQDFDGVVVKGRSYTDKGEEHGYWCTDAVTIDVRKARMVFSYSFDVLSRPAGLTGMSTFDFERKSASHPPEAFSGFAHDLNDRKRIAVHATKLGDWFVPWEEALPEAKRLLQQQCPQDGPSKIKEESPIKEERPPVLVQPGPTSAWVILELPTVANASAGHQSRAGEDSI